MTRRPTLAQLLEKAREKRDGLQISIPEVQRLAKYEARTCSRCREHARRRARRLAPHRRATR